MRILTIITARGGSKRLPRKNIRNLGGKPLIVWSINTAKDIPAIVDILVSTDDKEIAEVAKSAGALVPWLRPSELATDTASSVDVCLHALDWYEEEKGKVDGVMLLQPTSPFRSRDTVLQGIKIFSSNMDLSVIGISSAKSHPMWCFEIEEGALRPIINKDEAYMRSQDLPDAYVINGAFYLISTEKFRKQRMFITKNLAPLIISAPEESLDIDTEWEWKLAEAMIQLKHIPVS